MAESNQVEMSIGEQVAELVRRKPKNFDVIFSVGPQKTKVEAVKILLKAASPVFETEFDQNWENGVVKEGEGIPLPEFDPAAFQLFVNLIISDKWSGDDLNSLNLAPNTSLSLLGLCRRYKITKAIKNLEKAAEDFIQNFGKFKDTAEFLKLSRVNLESIFSRDQIPLEEKEIFECASRWAENQCQQKKVEVTAENIREVLGSCFYEIRFPTMKLEDFTKVSGSKKNLFTMEEKVAIFEFIGTDADEKAKCGKSLLPFKINFRNPPGCSVLRSPMQINTATPFVCDGKLTGNYFQVDKEISLHGVGFLGPIHEDTHLDVTVQIRKYVAGFEASKFGSDKLKKTIFASKGKTFYFLFDAPITIEPNSYDSSWNTKIYVEYSLKGASNLSQHQVAKNPNFLSVKIFDVEFNLGKSWSNGLPLAELLYKLN